VRTTVDIPDEVLAPARVRAAELGISLREFIAEAVTTKVERDVERATGNDRKKSGTRARPQRRG
jgi:hypothetical protein